MAVDGISARRKAKPNVQVNTIFSSLRQPFSKKTESYLDLIKQFQFGRFYWKVGWCAVPNYTARVLFKIFCVVFCTFFFLFLPFTFPSFLFNINLSIRVLGSQSELRVWSLRYFFQSVIDTFCLNIFSHVNLLLTKLARDLNGRISRPRADLPPV